MIAERPADAGRSVQPPLLAGPETCRFAGRALPDGLQRPPHNARPSGAGHAGKSNRAGVCSEARWFVRALLRPRCPVAAGRLATATYRKRCRSHVWSGGHAMGRQAPAHCVTGEQHMRSGRAGSCSNRYTAVRVTDEPGPPSRSRQPRSDDELRFTIDGRPKPYHRAVAFSAAAALACADHLEGRTVGDDQRDAKLSRDQRVRSGWLRRVAKEPRAAGPRPTYRCRRDHQWRRPLAPESASSGSTRRRPSSRPCSYTRSIA